MRRFLLFLFIVALTYSANAQSVTTYTGTIKDLGNQTVTSGKVIFTLKPGVDSTVYDTARFIPQVITCKITVAGLKDELATDPCTVVANTSLSPAGTYFQVDICPYNACTSKLNTFSVGGTVDISTLVPTPATSTGSAIVDNFSDQSIGGRKSFQNINGRIFADAINAGDACTAISDAIAKLPAIGGIVDATGFSGMQDCLVNPFAGVTKSGTLLLGSATFRTTAQWQTPAGLKWRIIGNGRGDPNAHNTTIQAVTGFPTDGTAVIRIGGATSGLATHGTIFENLTVDCNGIATVGAFSADANEMSGLKRLDIANCSAIGFDFTTMVATGGAQNFVLDEIEVYPQTYGTASTVCGKLYGNATGPQQISNLTCFANPSAPANSCFTIDNIAGGRFDSLHGEHCVKVVNLGSTFTVDGLSFNTTNGGPGVTTVFEINNANTQNIVALNTIRHGATNLIVNNVSGHTYTDDKLSFYTFGNGALPRPECSSSNGGVCLQSSIAVLGDVNLNGNSLIDGPIHVISKDSSNIVNIGVSSGVSTAGPLTVGGALDATSLKVSGTAISSSNLSDAASLSKISGTPTANKAVCWKTASTLGYCSTVVDATGACTCN